jgi:hypothetical protein
MRNSAFVLSVFLVCSAVQSLACGFEKSKIKSSWKLTLESSRIQSISAVEPLTDRTLQDVDVRVITYKDRGLLIKAADGNGWWLFEKVLEFSHYGKPFAIYGSVNFPHVEKGKLKSMSGCNMNIVIYDENGDGSFETVVPYAFKI